MALSHNVKPTPILILGDATDFSGGLSRITRDIAGQLVRNPLFRVATLGRGAICSRKLPWHQYSIRLEVPGNDFGLYDLQRVWEDFAGTDRGIVFTIWDPTRLLWLSRPEFCPDQDVAAFLKQKHFQLWGYFPIDSTGPQDKLTGIAQEALLGYDRLLAYTKWSKDLIERSLGPSNARKRHLDWVPHGLMLEKWALRDKNEARKRFWPLLHDSDKLVGAIGTNQGRKDWGLVASVCQQLLAKDPHLAFWWHTDVEERAWSIPALLADFGLASRTIVTLNLTDLDLSWNYNACDLTLHPGLGEGFGYPIFESLLSGTPIIAGDYAGGADVVKQFREDGEEYDGACLVPPVAWRLEGSSNQVRPVYDPKYWAESAEDILDDGVFSDREGIRSYVQHLSWENIWPLFEKWLQEGLGR